MKKLSILFLFSVILIGCFYDKESDMHPQGKAPFCDTITPVTYSFQVRQIVDANCMGCHFSGGVLNYDFSTWDELNMAATNGFLMGCVNHQSGFNPMPQAYKLSPCQIRSLQIWVDAGAPQN